MLFNVRSELGQKDVYMLFRAVTKRENVCDFYV